jgi:HPt (histidine-containing phosphotransfer) domain-containing protein
MAESRDETIENEAGEAPIDLGHLRRMTFADPVLEREVLTLFDRQATSMLSLLGAAEPEALPRLAHAVKGSARGIGAWRVARAAAMLESAPHGDVAALMEALIEARSAVATILRGGL